MELQANMVKVTAVVVTYRSAHTLPPLLDALRKCHAEGAMHAVFVDNNSVDNTPEILAQQTDWSEVVLSKDNNGFGRGCNLGLAKVQTPYTLFLNPDASIHPDAVRSMVAYMDANPQVGILGPTTECGPLEGPKTYQGTSELPTPWSILRASVPLIARPTDLKPILPGEEPFVTGWVCGAVYLIRTDLAKRLGGFDPRFFLYWEEMDLCRRTADLGFETRAFPLATASHICGASSDDDDTRVAGCIGEHFYKSRRYYLIKHHGWFAATAVEALEFVFLWVRTLSDIYRGNGSSRIKPRLQAPLFSQPDPYP